MCMFFVCVSWLYYLVFTFVLPSIALTLALPTHAWWKVFQRMRQQAKSVRRQRVGYILFVEEPTRGGTEQHNPARICNLYYSPNVYKKRDARRRSRAIRTRTHARTHFNRAPWANILRDSSCRRFLDVSRVYTWHQLLFRSTTQPATIGNFAFESLCRHTYNHGLYI